MKSSSMAFKRTISEHAAPRSQSFVYMQSADKANRVQCTEWRPERLDMCDLVSHMQFS
jgi:hypothetical protein